jgi:hypothetical protein
MGIYNPVNLSNYHGDVGITGSLSVLQSSPFSGGMIICDGLIQCGKSITVLEDLQVEGAVTFNGDIINMLDLPTANPGPGTLWNNLNIVTVGT